MRLLIGAKPVSHARKISERGEPSCSVNSPLGTDNGDAVQRLEFAEHVFGEAIAGCQTHMELQVAVVARTTRDRQLGLDAVGHAQRNVLAGEEAQTVGARRLQVQQAHVAGQRLDAFYPRGDGLQRDVARAIRLRRLDHEVSDGGVATQQHLPRGFLAFGQDIIVWARLLIWPESTLALHKPQLPPEQP